MAVARPRSDKSVAAAKRATPAAGSEGMGSHAWGTGTRAAVWRAATGVVVAAALVAVARAQAPPAPPPVVVGRDAREGAQVIGKEFALRVRLCDVAGAGVQQVRVVRVAPDGNVTLPKLAPLKAEGVALATLEAQATAAYKAVAPNAAAFISIADRSPPATAPAPAPAPAATQPTTQPATAPAAT